MIAAENRGCNCNGTIYLDIVTGEVYTRTSGGAMEELK